MAVSRVLRRLLALTVVLVPVVAACPSAVDASRGPTGAPQAIVTRGVHGPFHPQTPHVGGFSTSVVRSRISGLQPRLAGRVLRSRTAGGGNFSLLGFPDQFGTVGINVTDEDYVAMAHTPSGLGAWLLTVGGTVVPVGDAPWLGDASVPGSSLAGGIDIAGTPTGLGYWILSADGDIGAYGSAAKLAGVPFDPLDPPVSLAATATGQGLWVLLAGGDYFTVGDAQALPETDPQTPVGGTAVAIERSAGGSGYVILLDTFSVLTFGDAQFVGDERLLPPGVSAVDIQPTAPVAGRQGYLVESLQGGATPFGSAISYCCTVLGPSYLALDVPPGGGYWELEVSGTILNLGPAPALPAAVQDEEWTVIYPGAATTIGQYTAMIGYGDGTSSSAVLEGAPGSVGFPVHSDHAYAGPGHYTVTVTVTGPGGVESVSIPTTIGTRFGYWMVAADGGVFPFGGAAGWGSTGNVRLNKPIVGMAAHGSLGYWLVASDGGIFPFGDAAGYGSTGAIRLNKPIVGMAATPTGRGYWLVASDGGIFPFGDAVQHAYGSTGAMRLNKPVVGMARTPTGNGYWLVAADGGIFPFGDAVGYGSTGAIRLNKPIVGMAVTATGAGYWLVAADGGIFPFGDARFHAYGSTGAIRLNKPIVAMSRTPSGNGYWLAASDGGVFPFGDAVRATFGSLGAVRLNQPVVGFSRT